MNRNNIFIVAACLILAACGGNNKSREANKFQDPAIVRICDLADRREGDSLIVFLGDSSARLRYEAALACASVQDSAAIQPLLRLLRDNDLIVRAAAAYALGQTPGVSPDSLISALLLETDNTTRTNLFEAIGKRAMVPFSLPGYSISRNVVSPSVFMFLDSIKVRTEADLMGYGKAMYWLNYQGMTDPDLMNRMPYILQYAVGESKLYLANAMIRHRAPVWFANNKDYIMNWLPAEKAAEVRIAIMNMIGAIGDDDARKVLLSRAISDSEDPRVRISAAMNLGRCENIVVDDLQPIISSTEPHLAQICVEGLSAGLPHEQATRLVELCKTAGVPVRAAALRILAKVAREEALTQIKSEIESSSASVYDQSFFIRAMGSCLGNEALILDITDKLKNSAHPVTRTAWADALYEMLHQEVVIRDIDLWKKITPELLKLFSLKDQGTLAILASIFADPALPVTAAVADPSAIRSAQAALVLPRDIETHNEMQRAITRMEGSEFEPMKVSYNHPINWEKVKELGKKIVVDVSTSKGDFVIELDVESAPGSVLNFVELVESGYFNGKFFHRVVPNFVIQTGCPIGDGYGGLEHTIRSEFATHDYRTGAVGLASAGKDTESCQWFVTHLPTFGLEGRYTIIGYVTEGMSTVQAVSVGDVINKVTIR